MKFSLLTLALVSATISNAQLTIDQIVIEQLPAYYDYAWDETFDVEKYDFIKHEGKEATIVFDRTILTHRPTASKTNLPFRKKITHRIYWIHEESAIDKMNEVYLYESDDSKVQKVQVRTIDAEGNVVEFDQTKLETVIKDEGSSTYKILAIPGVRIGSWVEILITYKGFSSQNRIVTREVFDVIQSDVVYVSSLPTQMESGKINPKMEGYNGYMLTSNELIEDGRATYLFRANNIPAQVTDESYLHEFAECPRVDLTTEQYVWSEVSYGFHRYYLALETLNKSGKVKKLLEEIGANAGTELARITAIERYIKEQISETEDVGLEFETTSSIIQNKVANTKGILMLYKTLIENCAISYKAYLAYDKEYIRPTTEFAFTFGLSEFIFYFPNSDVYVMPENNYYRAGKLANYLGGMPALFLRENFGYYDGEYLVTLPLGEKEYNVDRSVNRVTYNEDSESLKINTAKYYFGDRAIRERGLLNFKDDAEKEEQISSALLSNMENAKLNTVRTKNTEIGLNANSTDSVIYLGIIETEDMISPIGNGFLLNLPKVIGNQVSFYDEGARTHQVYCREAKVYDHTIEFVIPNGYEIQGIENLIFDRNYYSNVNGESMHISSFVSTAEIVDGILYVNVHEFYEEGLFPKNQIELFKSVVNGAYEFYIAQIKLVKI